MEKTPSSMDSIKALAQEKSRVASAANEALARTIVRFNMDENIRSIAATAIEEAIVAYERREGSVRTLKDQAISAVRLALGGRPEAPEALAWFSNTLDRILSE